MTEFPSQTVDTAAERARPQLAPSVSPRRLVPKREAVHQHPASESFTADSANAQLLAMATVIANVTFTNYVNLTAHTPHESFMSEPALSQLLGGEAP